MKNEDISTLGVCSFIVLMWMWPVRVLCVYEGAWEERCNDALSALSTTLSRPSTGAGDLCGRLQAGADLGCGASAAGAWDGKRWCGECECMV